MDYKIGSCFRIHLPDNVPYVPCLPNLDNGAIKHLKTELMDGEVVNVVRSNFEHLYEKAYTIIVENMDGYQFYVGVPSADEYFVPIYKRRKQ